MSYEAVPCMFRQGGNGEAGYAKIGLLIRPVAGTSGTNQTQPPNLQQLPSNMPGGPAPLRVQGQFRSGAPIQVVGDNAPRLLLPAQVKVRVGGQPDAVIGGSNCIGWQQAPGPIRGGTTFTSPTPSITSPTPCQMRSASACSSSSHMDITPLSPAPTLFNQHQFRSEAPSRVSLGRRSTPWHSGCAPSSDTSTSPDSGIQSAAATRPNSLTPAEVCTSVCEAEETAEEDLDFTDMPQLYPADLEHSDQPGPSCIKECPKEDNLSAHGSECETVTLPSVTINPATMDSTAIVEHLYSLDPEKANAIANMIKKKAVQHKRRSGDRQNSPMTPLKKSRPGSAASDELRKSEEEVKIEAHPHSVSPSLCREVNGSVPFESVISSPLPPLLTRVNVPQPAQSESDVRVAYRQAVQKMLETKLARLIETMTVEMTDLQVQRAQPGRRGQTTGRAKSPWEMETGKKRKRRSDEKNDGVFMDEKRSFPSEFKPREKKTQYKANEFKFHIKSLPLCKDLRTFPPLTTLEVNTDGPPVRSRGTPKESPRKVEKDKKRRETVGAVDRELFRQRLPTRNFSKRRNSEIPLDEVVMEKKKDMDYIQINKSFCADPSLFSDWALPRVMCGCSRGACTSDAECINRALCVQCPQNCHMQLCVNKKFWKEDAVRQLSCTVINRKRSLKTKIARRAGDFLGEFAGEVISYSTACSRWSQHSSGDTVAPPPIIALSSKLFVDATEKGNITRYIRHSCKPNCRVEIWSIGEHLRAGLFPINDISSGSELTINMNGLLPTGRKCTCTAERCRKWIGAAKNAVLAAAETELPSNETSIVRETRVFLLRNRRSAITKAAKRHLVLSSTVPTDEISCMRKVFQGLQRRIRHVDGTLPSIAHQGYCRISHLLSVLSRNDSPASSVSPIQSFKSAVERWLIQLDDDDYDRVYSALCLHYLSNLPSTSTDSPDKKNGKIAKQEMDLSYLDTHVRVNSYNPDDAWSTNNCKEGDDAVRCECGLLEEDGEMLQCDQCHFWLHTDCVGNVDENTDYVCRFCKGDIKGGTPSTDVLLHKKLEMRFEECLYFKALLNGRGMQVRLNETVYVKKAVGDEHKKILSRFESNQKKKKQLAEELSIDSVKPPTQLKHEEFDRKDLRIFRVDRLFYAPGGQRFVFGFYYAWPHETICDSYREFNSNEVFATPYYDTLPLDAVVGRCSVLDPENWSKGRPTVPLFKEEDVFVCEYRINKNQRICDKVPSSSRFYINTQPYVFRLFPTPQELLRQFTPFIGHDKSSPRNSKNQKAEDARRDEIVRRMASQSLDTLVSHLQPVKASPKSSDSRKSSSSEGRRKNSSL